MVNAAGSYNAFEFSAVTPNASVTPNALTINPTAAETEGNWSQVLGDGAGTDSGGWLALGKSVALVVSSSSARDNGCVFLGTVGAAGINKNTPTRKRGPDNCNGVAGTWYATPASESAAPSGAASPRVDAWHGAVRRTYPSVSAVGTYSLFLGNGETGTLTINSGDTWSSSLGGSTGYWVSQGKSIALVVTASTTNTADCAFLGTVKASGINASATKKQGPVGCPGNLSTGWYATKG
jgi:hypothetical protein